MRIIIAAWPCSLASSFFLCVLKQIFDMGNILHRAIDRGTYLYSFLIKYDRRRSVGLRKRTELLHRKRAWLRRLRKSPAQ